MTETEFKKLFIDIKTKRASWKKLKSAQIRYSQYIAENIDKTISYGEYISENLNQAITYSQYVSEPIYKSIYNK